jgi:transposase
LLGWLGGFGTVCLVGIEWTGSYGAGLARHVTAAGIRQGKSDPLDAVSAARAAQCGRARGASKGRDGAVAAIRALMVAKRSAAGDHTQTINQARALVLTGPEDLRAGFTGHTVGALVAELAWLRPRPGDAVGYATRVALRAGWRGIPAICGHPAQISARAAGALFGDGVAAVYDQVLPGDV